MYGSINSTYRHLFPGIHVPVCTMQNFRHSDRRVNRHGYYHCTCGSIFSRKALMINHVVSRRHKQIMKVKNVTSDIVFETRSITKPTKEKPPSTVSKVSPVCDGIIVDPKQGIYIRREKRNKDRCICCMWAVSIVLQHRL